MYTPYFLTSFDDNTGQYNYGEPFLAPDKAFPVMENMYSFRGSIVRREGFKLVGRLRRVFDFKLPVTLSTQANGASYTIADVLNDPSFNLRNPGGGAISETYAEIEPGSFVALVGASFYVDNGDGTLAGSSPTDYGTINYITGELNLFFDPPLGAATNVDISFSYFPALPVMGLRRREQSDINEEQTIAFDQKYAYRLTAGLWEELPSTLAVTWQGLDYNFFWTTNYWRSAAGNDLFWETNGNKTANPDPMYYYDGTTWTIFRPIINAAADHLEQCLMLIPYKDRLIALNTWEGASLAAATQYPRRARWSQNGSPIDQVNGWLDDTVGRGGYVDAPTNEHIVSAAFIKDVLIVKFERSSWRLVYTGNEVLPFIWQRINSELGSESTFSTIGFDDAVLTVGNYGLTADDSVNVVRIDQTIPQTIFSFSNSGEGPQRIHGIRDYAREIALWTYHDSLIDGKYPNRCLIYNYRNKSFATFRDAFTCFGHFQYATGLTWASYESTWAESTLQWNSGATQAWYPNICAGNQQGYVFVLNQGTLNDTSLSITEIDGTVVPCEITSPYHGLENGDVIEITGCIGTSSVLNDRTFTVGSVDTDTFVIYEYSPVTNTWDSVDLGGAVTYLGDGKISVLSNFNLTTKNFMPLVPQGSRCRIPYMDVLLDASSEGEMTFNMYVDENSSESMTTSSPSITSILGTNVLKSSQESATLYPFQAYQGKIWHRIYLPVIAQSFQFKFYESAVQMVNKAKSQTPVKIHAIVMYISKNARLSP